MLLILVSFYGHKTRKGLASYCSDYYEGRTTVNDEIFRLNKK